MSTNKIFCLGDGFAHGHIWPEWPQILQALLPDHNVIEITGIGAGNEFLINGLLSQDISNSTVIFQWAEAERFDKVIEDDYWPSVIKQDPVYHFNIVERNSVKWWLSSASTAPDVQQYHRRYVQSTQAQMRLKDQQTLIESHVKLMHSFYISLSTIDQEQFSRLPEFEKIRGREVQPSPIVHFWYLDRKVLPILGVAVDVARKNQLQQLLESTLWTAYDCDRHSLWQDLVNKL